MTNKKKTEAGAVELEENELNDVTGGAVFLKIDTIPGESSKDRNVKLKADDDVKALDALRVINRLS